ncbi:MAG: hypothetical protein ACREM2_09285 [Vulcanimicrobiaceae bacterium]
MNEKRIDVLENRLGRIEQKVDDLGLRLDAKIEDSSARLDAKIGRSFRWSVGTMLASWATLLGSLAGIASLIVSRH